MFRWVGTSDVALGSLVVPDSQARREAAKWQHELI